MAARDESQNGSGYARDGVVESVLWLCGVRSLLNGFFFVVGYHLLPEEPCAALSDSPPGTLWRAHLTSGLSLPGRWASI